jgi:hypothetical protein
VVGHRALQLQEILAHIGGRFAFVREDHIKSRPAEIGQSSRTNTYTPRVGPCLLLMGQRFFRRGPTRFIDPQKSTRRIQAIKRERIGWALDCLAYQSFAQAWEQDAEPWLQPSAALTIVRQKVFRSLQDLPLSSESTSDPMRASLQIRLSSYKIEDGTVTRVKSTGNSFCNSHAASFYDL